MPVLCTGSVAVDHIMVFRGRFRDVILPDKVHMLNVAFHVPELRRSFGGTAANIAFSSPWKMLKLAVTGLRTSGPMAPEIDLSKARPGEDHHERLVTEEMDRLERDKAA